MPRCSSAILVVLTLAPPLAAAEPLILAHDMPVRGPSAARPVGMALDDEGFRPRRRVAGKPEIASHCHPLIGPYDSGDPDALEYHALLMRLGGSDGIIVDWYGREDYLDYAGNRRNTARFAEAAGRTGLKFAAATRSRRFRNWSPRSRLAASDRLGHGPRTRPLRTWASPGRHEALTEDADTSTLQIEGTSVGLLRITAWFCPARTPDRRRFFATDTKQDMIAWVLEGRGFGGPDTSTDQNKHRQQDLRRRAAVSHTGKNARNPCIHADLAYSIPKSPRYLSYAISFSCQFQPEKCGRDNRGGPAVPRSSRVGIARGRQPNCGRVSGVRRERAVAFRSGLYS